MNKILACVILKFLFSFFSNLKKTSQHFRSSDCIIFNCIINIIKILNINCIIIVSILIIIKCLNVRDLNESKNSETVTSLSEEVSLMKNMLMMPRYLMIFAPGMKESGVILTTATELPE